MNILKTKFIFCSFLLLIFSILSFTSVNAEEWMGYSIKKSDYSDYQGDERIPYMIFLDRTTYNSKSECYDKMVRKTPLTRASTYMVNCIEASKVRCHEFKQQMAQGMKTYYVDFGAFQKLTEHLNINKKNLIRDIDKSILLLVYVAMHKEDLNDADFSQSCRQKVFDSLKQEKEVWIRESRTDTEELIKQMKGKREELQEIVNKEEKKYKKAIEGVEKIKKDFLQSGGEFYLDLGSSVEDLATETPVENAETSTQKICYFGADADHSIANTIWYVNKKIEDYNCKKGDILDFRMQDGWNQFPQMFIDSACDFNYSITRDRYIRTAENGYEDKITVFSCIYKGKHTDYRFNCDYDSQSDKCIPR